VTLLETHGNRQGSQWYRCPPDFIDPDNLPAEQPWGIFTAGKIALSRNGVEASGVRKIPVYGIPNRLYQNTPAVVNGAVVPVYQLAGDYVNTIVKAIKDRPLRGGPRGVNIMNPYCAWHGHPMTDENGVFHPQAPMWIGMLMTGQFTYAYQDGRVSLEFTVPITTYANDFSYYEPRSAKLLFVTDTGAGTILKVDRSTSPPTTTVFAEGFGLAQSVRAFGGHVYVAGTNAVWEVAMDGTKTKLCTLGGAFWLDYTSTGELVVATRMRTLHKVNVDTGVVGPSLAPKIQVSLQHWVTCSVDRAGAFGEKDSIVIIASKGTSSEQLHRVMPNGAVKLLNYGAGKARVGVGKNVAEIFGHYPWVAEYHPEQAAMAVQGFANTQLGIIIAVDPLDAYPKEDIYDDALMALGIKQLVHGSSDPAKWGTATTESTYPSFTCLMNSSGGSFLGCSADVIGEMEFDDALAFIRKGMIGQVPRPDFTRVTALPLMYTLYRSSQRFLRIGAPLIADLRKWSAT
jgi:hypothetical protein